MRLRIASARDAAQTAEDTDAERVNSQDDEAEVGIVNRTDAGVRITLRRWCKAEDCWQVQKEVHRALLGRFRERDLRIA